VPEIVLERTIQDLNEHGHGRVADLALNLDEVGISDWEDRKTRRVVVPATMVARRYIMPYIVTSQNSSPVHEQLRKQGVLFGRD
jgi:hypothetical protein